MHSLRLSFGASHFRDETDVDIHEVFLLHSELKLPESFHKGHSFDISDRPSQLKSEKMHGKWKARKLSSVCPSKTEDTSFHLGRLFSGQSNTRRER